MKKIYTIGLFIFAGIVLHAQTKPIMVDTGRLWTQINGHNILNVDNGTSDYKRTTFYKFTTDTSISGKTYKKVQESTDSMKTWICNKYIREDISKKIYFIQKDSTQELLLYQFGLKIFDNVNVTYPSDSNYVEEVDSVVLNGKFRKRYQIYNRVTDSQIDSWIDGIGSYYGLFYPYDSNVSVVNL